MSAFDTDVHVLDTDNSVWGDCACSNLTSCRSSRRRLKTSFTSWSPTRPAMCTCPRATVRSWTGTLPTWSLPTPPRSATSLSSTGTRMTTLSSLAATSQVKCLPAFYLVHASPHCETRFSRFDKVVVIPYVGVCIAVTGVNGHIPQFHVRPVSLSALQTHCHSCCPFLVLSFVSPKQLEFAPL